MIIPSTILHLRAVPETTEDKSNIITIVTWATLVLSVLVFLARQCIKFAKGHKAGIDDFFILAATIFAVGLSVTVLILASDGLGVLGILTIKRANTIMKGYYASDFLYVSSLCFAKLSLMSLFYGVLHKPGQRRLVLGIGIFILAWTLASLAAVAFQCGLPRPWEILTLHCFNTGVFWIVYCIIDMTTDVAIIMLSVNLVAYLKVPNSKKVAVVACFAPRILVIGAALARLIYLYPISPHNKPEFNLWIPLICTQVQDYGGDRKREASMSPSMKNPMDAALSDIFEAIEERKVIPKKRLAYEDPLRTQAVAMTTSAAVPAPVPAVIPVGHTNHSSIPSYYVQTPPIAHDSTFSSPQSVPSYYITTPPTAQPPTFPSLSNPYAYEIPPPPPVPTSPQRQRNKRILTPQNSSRRDQMSPVSPVSPPTPLTFWREESSSGSAGTQRSPGGWEEAQLMPVVKDVRNSPRIVVQKFQ
ncbi:hypothetical protein N0V90_004284 [Kalmusia sp. IMI 367209]|nr:hypothetical protein N0V90_004284 [Kalmusia sp. IMI 367209]